MSLTLLKSYIYWREAYLHHPYQSFASSVRENIALTSLVWNAWKWKMTSYKTDNWSNSVYCIHVEIPDTQHFMMCKLRNCTGEGVKGGNECIGYDRSRHPSFCDRKQFLSNINYTCTPLGSCFRSADDRPSPVLARTHISIVYLLKVHVTPNTPLNQRCNWNRNIWTSYGLS